jgi:kynurenine 3-monooxygenase
MIDACLQTGTHYLDINGDIAVFEIIPVKENQHARFDATLRTYDYFIHTYKDPFLSEVSSLYLARALRKKYSFAGISAVDITIRPAGTRDPGDAARSGRIGIADEALRHAIPMRGRMIHDKSGALHFAPYDVDPQKCINSIGRASLNAAVIEAAQRYPDVRVHFNHKCTDVDLEKAVCHFETETGKLTARGDAVIGVDGAFSAVRASMQQNIDNFQYYESYLAHGYKELTIPPGPNDSWQMEKNTLHIWPRKSFMMIALPNPDGSFTCTLFWEFEGPRSFATAKTEDDVRRFFDEEFPDAVPLMPTLLEDFKNNPTGSLVTIRCAPWNYRDRVCLLGDAAHAVVPFYGQGMNAAFEDCVVLDECLEKFANNRERAFAEYFSRRKENADALADLAHVRQAVTGREDRRRQVGLEASGDDAPATT